MTALDPGELALWQRLLRSFDVTVAVTGVMDVATGRATAEWQDAAGVKATGKPDAATWAAVERALAFLDADRPEARRELAAGDRGKDVAYLQRRLNARGHGVAINGVYDHRVRRAVARFQADAGLASTGEVDSATWSVLD